MCDIFTRTLSGSTTLSFDVTAIVKPGHRTCGQGRFCNKITETMLPNIHRIKFTVHVANLLYMLQTLDFFSTADKKYTFICYNVSRATDGWILKILTAFES